MNIYKVSWSRADELLENWAACYLGAVVVAESVDQAKTIHPSGNNSGWADRRLHGMWADHLDELNVQYVGTADPSLNYPHVLLASWAD